MNTTSTRALAILSACGLAAGVAGAQPFLINGSGATLQEAIFNAPASTNDFLDIDGDGISTPDVDQLAPFDATPPFIASQHWQVTYRVVGSGNGLAELVAWGGPGVFATAEDGSDANGTLNCSFVDSALFNRTEFCAAGEPTNPIYEPINPGGIPFRSFIATFPQVDVDNDMEASGIHIDFAALDVPVSWATFVAGEADAAPEKNPTTIGYGDNPRLAINKDGSLTGDDETPPWDNKLESLGDLNTNQENPDDKTVFDTPLVLTPIAAIVNFGVGMQEIRMSDLRHLAATGRRDNGENLTKVTRDSGSGTRNGFMNAICLDPSWGVGENIGTRTVDSANDLVGPDYQPSNKGGSSRMEGTIINTRLGVGHTGAERGESKGWLINAQAECLAVISDLKGGSVAARPSLENVLFNDENGYTIITNAVLSTVGDPRNEDMIGGEPGNVNPAPMNPQVAAYINNITRSTKAFKSLPGDDETLFSPGEFLASQFLLTAAASFVPSLTDPCVLLENPDFNPVLQDFILNDSGNVLGLPEFQTYNTESAGLVPTRTSGVDYGDGAAGDNYLTQGGNELAYGTMLPMRNRVAGDFDGDGLRTIEDFGEMILAYEDRQGGAPWSAPSGPNGEPGADACIEILGDHNGDGSFTAQDVRYAADGLAMAPDGEGGSVLDRRQGFIAVDMLAGGNFFATALATGSYEDGDSRADVAGPGVAFDTESAQWLGVTRGWEPIGHDGTVDAYDIDYVCAQFATNPFVTDGEATWNDLNEAVGFDLSCDMNGDLVVNADDVAEIVENVLDTALGDVNLDGVVDGTDLAIAQGNLGNPGGWADGDMNCDGQITQADLDIIQGVCAADCNDDGALNILDFVCFQGEWQAQTPLGDCDGNGQYNILDFVCFQGLFQDGCD
jgi:hypothetical protein